MENEEQIETGELDSQEDNTSENENDNVETLLAQKKHFRNKFEKEKQAKEQALKELEELKKKPKEQETETPKNDEKYTLRDIRALNDVHDDDVDEVRDFAKYKDISIAEAKKHPVIQTLLREHAQARETAKAANTGGGKRGTTNLTDEQIINEAESGKEIDPDKFAEARLNVRIKNKKGS